MMKIQLNFNGDEKEKISVGDGQKVRYVDTRTSTVEIEKIESRERLESMVSDNMRNMEGGRSKQKKNNKDTVEQLYIQD